MWKVSNSISCTFFDIAISYLQGAAIGVYLARITPDESEVLVELVILLYDHLITLGSEFELIWNRRRRMPSIFWFALNRYGGLLINVAAFVGGIAQMDPEVRAYI